MESRKLHVTFKLAEPGQKKLLVGWLYQEHVQEWLHGAGLDNLLQNLDRFFKGASDSQHWIAYDGKTPFAYFLTTPIEKDAIGLDLFICDPNYIGKGYAVPMIRDFLMTHFARMKTIFIDPEATNTRAIHVYQKVGFKIIGEFIASWHPVPHYEMKLNMQDLLKAQ